MDKQEVAAPLYLWDQKDDIDFFRSYIRFSNEQRNAEESVSTRVFNMALKFNKPDEGRIAATAFKQYVASLVEKLKSETQFDTKIFGFAKDKDDITGNGAFANAFKRVYGAMWYGGNLQTLGTVSACARFAREAAQKEREQTTKDQLREQVATSVAASPEWFGKDTNVPEFERAVNVKLTEILNQQEQSRKDTDESHPQGDIWDTRGQYVAGMLRAIYEKSPNDADDMYNAFEGRVEKKFEEMYHQNAEEYLRKVS